MPGKKKILLVGAGSLGVYFISRLARSGFVETALVVRSEYEVVSRQRGYSISDKGEEYFFQPDHILRNTTDCPFEPDYIFLCTKVLPGIPVAELIRPALAAKTIIVLIQNGIDIENEIAAAFPEHSLFSSIAYLCASRPAPGKILNDGPGKLEMGVYPSGSISDLQELTDLFAAGGTLCTPVQNILQSRWRKLLWNIPYNPVSVLAGEADTGWMCDRGELEKLCYDLMLEVIAVAASTGVELGKDEAAAMVEYTRRTPPYKSSMLQDYQAGRPLEVEAILGNALRIARKNQVYVPKMEVCYALLRSVDVLRTMKRNESNRKNGEA